VRKGQGPKGGAAMARCARCGRTMTSGRCTRCGVRPTGAGTTARLAAVGLVVAIAVGLLAALAAREPVGLSQPTIAIRIDPTTGAPLDAMQVLPRETQVIYAAIRVRAKAGDVIAVRWFVAGEHLGAFDQETRLDRRFSGWRTWSAALKDSRPWPAAPFTVRFYRNGVQEKAVDFQVQ